MIVRPSQSIAIVRDQTDADGLPAANTHTAVLWKNGLSTAEVVTVTNPTTGVYKFAWTIPANSVQDDIWSLRVVDGDGYAATVWEGITDTQILDTVSYNAAALYGACADPQTSAETYAITINGSTYTLDYASQTAAGIRGTTTRTKT